MSSEKPYIVIDGHLDLSMNAMEWNRDLRWTVKDIRTSEEGMTDLPDRGNNTVSFPSMKAGNIKLCIATLIARYAKPDHPSGGWNSPEQAWGMTSAQLAWYKEMEKHGHLVQIKQLSDLQYFADNKPTFKNDPMGFILSLEGADSLVTFDHLYERYNQGLRAIGPAHYGPGTYAYGTDSDAPLSTKGKELLYKMDELGIVLDATHLCDSAFWEALELYKGPVWASHNNCRSLVDHNRQFTDEQIKALIERDAIIGLPLDAWMMVPNWQRAISHPSNTSVTLNDMMNHMEHICQIAGNANHVAIGTDLDGGFGTEQGPSDLDTIADLQKIPTLLKERGFSHEEIEGVMYKNWLRKIKEILPE
ncbi:MAG: membrane dipeptidase [Saprospiraceae bacterium]